MVLHTITYKTTRFPSMRTITLWPMDIPCAASNIAMCFTHYKCLHLLAIKLGIACNIFNNCSSLKGMTWAVNFAWKKYFDQLHSSHCNRGNMRVILVLGVITRRIKNWSIYFQRPIMNAKSKINDWRSRKSPNFFALCSH